MDQHFTRDDLQKVTDFLNSVAKHAKFEVNTQELITHFKLLAHMQNKIIPKLEANILEVTRVIEPSKEGEA
jgi:hypothetical protein